MGESVIGNDEVVGSIPTGGSTLCMSNHTVALISYTSIVEIRCCRFHGSVAQSV